MKLRPYQQAAADAAIAWIKKSTESCVIEAETGAGKSLMIAAIAKTFYEISGKHVLCTAPNVDLVRQNTEKYLATGNKASIFSASIGKSLRYPVVFGTPITIHNQIEKFGAKFGLICIDECHGITPTIQKIIEEIRVKNPNLRVIGLSATPFRLGSGLIYAIDEHGKPSPEKQCVDPYFAKKVFTIGGRELIDQGYLTKPIIGAIHGDHYDTINMRINSMGKFYQEDIDRAYEGQNRKTASIIADIIAQAKNRNGVMVFAATVKHAMECMESLPPELSRMIGGDINTKKEQRKKLVNDFKQQKYKYLVSVGTMTTGVDFTHVDLIALMRATESIGLLKQCIGRGLRLHEGKTDCLVLDYAENIERHCGEDGDIFNPKISAKKASGGGEGLSVICPSCETENEFTARPNPDGFKMDSSGYFLDLMGERIDTPYGPMPSHMGRRCFGMQLVLGKLERCLYRWSPKKCPHCFADNDIAARYCSECRGEIVDPNNSLIDIYKPAVKDPYQQQTERVIAWHTKKAKSKKDEDMLIVNYITENKKLVIFYLVRRPEYAELVKATNGGETKPETLTYIKDVKTGYYRALAYNQQEDRLNVTN